MLETLSSNSLVSNQEKNYFEYKKSELQHRGGIKPGDFVMVTREVIRVLSDKRIIDLTAADKSLILTVLDLTIGQHCYFRSISVERFLSSTGLSRSTIFERLAFLIEKGLIKTEKRKGMRDILYGLNIEFFGRVYPGQIENVYYLDKFKVQPAGLLESDRSDFESPVERTKNSPRAAPRANSANPNISSKISSNISQREIFQFIESRSQNTKNRWTELINGIVDKNPDDQSLLWLAIEMVEKTKTDFLGRPIHSSILCLFESTDWGLMKAVLLAKLKTEKEQQEKRQRRDETERLVEEKRKSLVEITDGPIDVSKISPLFKHFALKGGVTA